MAAGVWHQLTSDVLMVRPSVFGFNPENADNTFAQPLSGDHLAGALLEFEGVVTALRAAGLTVCVLDDRSGSPDAIFPNNWVALGHDGGVTYFPMKAGNRRREVRHDLPAHLQRWGYRVTGVNDLSPWAEQGHFLEGTGCLILDHPRRRAYVARSERTHPAAIAQWAAEAGYAVEAFTPVLLVGAKGEAHPVYHTNVLMALGEGVGVWCPEAVTDEAERTRLAQHWHTTERTMVALTLAQVQAFAGNMLQVQGNQGPLLLMSQTAYVALTSAQIQLLEKHTQLLAIPIPTIEQVGGGSLRCMLAEIFLPRFD